MERGTTIIGIGFLLLMIMPIIVYYTIQKIDARKFARHFIHSSAKYNLLPDQNDIWRKNYALGIDHKAKKLIYLNKGKVLKQEVVIDLTKVAKCREANGIKSLKNDIGTSEFADFLGLVFSFKDPQMEEVTLEFYNGSELMSHPDGEKEIADKWLATVNSCLKTI